MTDTRLIAPPACTYRGTLTTPERWRTWTPRRGDVVVCTSAKCGTTWTQSILAMLLNGGPDLPGPVPVLSPWVDSALGSAEEVTANLAAQAGARVVKTHTPGDGIPRFEGVRVVAVYRHPLDVFLSLRNHAMNMRGATDHPMRRPIPQALEGFMTAKVDRNDIDRDSLSLIVHHLHRTVPVADLTLHYARMVADPRAAVTALARLVGREGDTGLIDAVTEATGFAAMRARASDFVPEGGRGFWQSDAAFFDSGTAGRWAGAMQPEDVARYDARMAALLPDAAVRHWLETGDGPLPG